MAGLLQKLEEIKEVITRNLWPLPWIKKIQKNFLLFAPELRLCLGESFSVILTQ